MAQEGADVAWSTRELADLAGTTVNTVRHYHRLGLLEEPTRRYNGYKQYGIEDLVRLLRIRRLVGLGVPLAQIQSISSDGDNGSQVLRQVDTYLAAEVERLRKVRSDIAAILRDGGPADTPSAFGAVAPRLSSSDSSLLHVIAQLCDEDALADLKRMLESDPDPVDPEFDALPAEADEATRQRLAESLTPTLVRHLFDYPWLSDPAARLVKSENVTRQTFVDAVVDLYNPAQIDVLGRASILAQEQMRLAHKIDDATSAA
uniref:MerR family transcriptional regulator n=1 Tax=Paractinoplanes polyasparticus TaxID=2856853 RepID=UPI001C850754|nr:MerR family transcriptional regulator [Actinoplanes polyasparticus]